MNRRWTVLALAALVFLPVAAEEQAPQDDDQKTLYALGLAVSRNLNQFDFSAEELQQIQAGLADGVLGREPKVALEVFGPRIEQMLRARMEAKTARLKEEGGKFLAEMAAADGATKTESGMVYFMLQEGSGPQPEAEDTVRLHYHGTFPDGEVFDTSRDGEPASFKVSEVVACFSEGIQATKVGGKTKMICPPEMAYGDRGSAPFVPPGATLVFEVELLEVIPAAPVATEDEGESVP